jgi:lipooligosaccharide transport system permease protein
VTNVVSPVLFLASLGVGLGQFVRHAPGGGSYLDYLAPALLATTAMQTAVGESTWPVTAAVRWTRQYHAMLATPLDIPHVVAGHLLWIATRIAMATGIYLVVMASFGAARSGLAVLAWPAAVLTGAAFAGPVVAFAATRTNDAGFAMLQRFIVVPMFLFSGTFFPISQLPLALRPIAYATPLWHGVALCRGLALGTIGAAGVVGHTAFLVAVAAIGTIVSLRAYRRQLTP